MCRNLTSPLPSFQMNDSDINQFIKALKDFIKHAEVEKLYHQSKMAYLNSKKTAQKTVHDEIEKKAAELEVTVDYYLAEFM
jgi:hypothetical protein